MIKKNFKIKQSSKRVSEGSDIFETAWTLLNSAIQEIYRKNASVLSFEELYRNAYNLVIHKYGDRLYLHVNDKITEHLTYTLLTTILPLSERSLSGGSLSFLIAVSQEWEHFSTFDRSFIKGTEKPPIYDLGMNLFQDIVINSKTHPTRTHLLNSLLLQIKMERQGLEIDKLIVKKILSMLMELNVPMGSTTSNTYQSVYHVYFEQEYCNSTTRYYQEDSLSMMNQLNTVEYLEKVKGILRDEEIRSQTYLHPTSIPLVETIIHIELISNHVISLINSKHLGLASLLSTLQFAPISIMYTLFKLTPNGYSAMKSCVSEYVRKAGHEINLNYGGKLQYSNESLESIESLNIDNSCNTNPLKWVQSIIDLVSNLDKLMDSFKRDNSFQNDINHALEHVFKETLSSPEYVSLFIDEQMRKGIKGKTDQEIELLLDLTISLFRFVSDKDVFERYYKKHLAKRLLGARSLSEDAERSMISKLKVECGSQFTFKLEGMFNDMHLSSELSMEFRNGFSDNPSLQGSVKPIEMTVNVLTTTSWPISTGSTCNYPKSLQFMVDSFSKFYTSKYSGRRLTWLPNHGTADLRANFELGKKELNVSTLCLIVLTTCFNESTNPLIPYSDIQSITGISDSDLKRTLITLSMSKYKILIKTSNTQSREKDVSPSDSFSINESFTAPQTRIKIVPIAATPTTNTETELERIDTMNRIDEARRYQIEAALVRIMKSRKTLEHNTLVSEAIQQLAGRFSVTSQMVKGRIEGLLEREYIERCPNDRKVYRYLA